ncbi:MAG: hypothetical protein FWD91_06435 [Treponema sp.]|nr:hypothetical protein [Treponema sp.]
MTTQIRELGARLRNLFQVGEFRRRYDDGRIQVQTRGNNVLEKAEAFPYGFYAVAKNGTALVVCQGGDTGSFQILPLLPGNDVKRPDLKSGDTALYTASGGYVVCRNDGALELYGKESGGLVKVDELTQQLAVVTARLDAIINALKNSPTVPNDGGSAYKAAIVSALSAIANKEDFSRIASEKVFHG